MAQRYIASYKGLFPSQGIKRRLCCIMTVVKPLKNPQISISLLQKEACFQKDSNLVYCVVPENFINWD